MPFDLITQGENPTPQLPGQMQINSPKVQPGNTSSAAPTIPSTAPPNVDGGQASFSSLTKSISDLVAAKTSELAASNDALQANNSVDKSATTALSGITQSNLEALSNINKANSLPGGARGKLAQIIGLFDSDYNYDVQATNIKINETKSNQITATAAALKQQNNELPALLSKVSEAQKLIFDAQKDANTLSIEQGKLDNQQLQTKISAARLRIEMSQEGRAASEFRIKSMTTAQLEAALPQAQAGKGPLAGAAGLIEDRLLSEKMAMANLAKANLELQKGNREEYNNATIDAVSHMPADIVASLMAKAQASGSPMVEFPTGEKGKDGKPTTMQVPFNLVQQALVQNLKIQGDVNNALAADYTQRLNIIPNSTNLMNVGNAFASVDPRATQLVTQLGGVLKSMDTKNPQSVRQTGIVLGQLKTQMDKIVKENADKFSTKEAKAAVIAYGGSGKFDAQGGAAVMADSTGIPALSTQSRYKGMWKNLSIQVANEIAKQHIINAPTVDTNADAMSILAQMQAKPSGKEKIEQITANILSDPSKTAPLAKAIKGVIQGTSIMNVIGSFTQQKNADPFWNSVAENIGQFKTNGSPDAAKLFAAMERASIKSGGKINYAQQFLTGLENYAVNADNSPQSDASYTIQDHAAEAALFGGNPNSVVLGDLHYKLRVIAERVAAEMRERINEDVTGKTQAQAIQQAGVGRPGFVGDPEGGFGSFLNTDPETIFKKTGVDVNSVPSATGTGLTAAQIKAMYPGGLP
jgi:hypothetical protein